MNRKKTALALALLLSAAFASTPAAQANFWRYVAQDALGNTFGNVLTTAIYRGIFSSGSSDKEKDASEIFKGIGEESSEWVAAAGSSGGTIFYNKDTLNPSDEKGKKTVAVTMKTVFTEEGSEALIESSAGRIQKSARVSYSIYHVVFGEKECKLDGPVIYYDANGKKLLETGTKDALLDMKTSRIGAPYRKGSMEMKVKEAVFARAGFDEAEESKSDKGKKTNVFEQEKEDML